MIETAPLDARPLPRFTFPGMDAIRLAAALAVVYAHSFPIGTGVNTPDPLVAAFGGDIGLGDYAVRVFFIMSGFLLSGSLDAAPDPLRYLVNRLLRLIPGFAFAVVVSILLFAPLMSDPGWRLVFSRDAWSSIYWSISCLTDLVKLKLSPVPQPELGWFINGSLWSIPYELVCYLVLLTLHMLLRKDSKVAWAAAALAVASMAGPRLGIASVARDAASLPVTLPFAMLPATLPYFCGGVAYYSVFKRWGLTRGTVAAAALMLAASPLIGLEAEALAIAGPVLLIQAGSHRTMLSRAPDALGDISYGVYLFGWPAGLLIASATGVTNGVWIFALSVPLVVASAYAMHHLVERPVGERVRPFVLRWLPRLIDSPRNPSATPARGAVRLSRAAAYGFLLVMVARFAIYPYPFSLNWYGFQIRQLTTIVLATAAILAAGTWFERRRVNFDELTISRFDE